MIRNKEEYEQAVKDIQAYEALDNFTTMLVGGFRGNGASFGNHRMTRLKQLLTVERLVRELLAVWDRFNSRWYDDCIEAVDNAIEKLRQAIQ